MKPCTKCGVDKPEEDYYLHARNKSRRYSHCIECCRADNYKRYVARKDCEVGKEKGRRYSLMRYYGITLEQYEEMLIQQDYRCILCKKHQDECRQNFAVDHNHETGEIRALACTHCNHRVIGKHNDPELLRWMADYIVSGTGVFVPEEFKGGIKRARSLRQRRKKRND